MSQFSWQIRDWYLDLNDTLKVKTPQKDHDRKNKYEMKKLRVQKCEIFSCFFAACSFGVVKASASEPSDHDTQK